VEHPVEPAEFYHQLPVGGMLHQLTKPIRRLEVENMGTRCPS
jgi:hypothetical protein